MLIQLFQVYPFFIKKFNNANKQKECLQLFTTPAKDVYFVSLKGYTNSAKTQNDRMNRKTRRKKLTTNSYIIRI